MSLKKVTVLSACYNCTLYVSELLDSVLNQDYNCIEMILMDDGSLDNLLSYINDNKYFDKFLERGFELKYFFQANQGQATAIKNGLKYVNGEYLIWPDSDDFLSVYQISKMVKVFDSNDSIGIVRCYSNHVNEKGEIQSTFQGMNNKKIGLGNIFVDCLYITDNMYFGAGNYMVKFDLLKQSMKSFDIFEHKLTGQNWQLILPITYHFKCFTIPEKLHNIVQLSNSHSRNKKSLYENILTLISHRNTLLHTLNNISNMDVKEYKNISLSIKKIYLKRILSVIKSSILNLFK